MKCYTEQANKLVLLFICLEFKFISSITDCAAQKCPNSGLYFLTTKGLICGISDLPLDVCRTFHLLILYFKNM